MATGKLTIEEKMKLPWEGYDSKKRSEETATAKFDESLTQQGQAEQADINWIVKNFMPQAIPQNVRIPMDGDFTGITDYRTALHQINEAEQSFMKMPGALRARLDNDPQKFIEWCADGRNIEEMRKLGLAVPKPAEPDTAGKPAEPQAQK